ncbi:hypothetical protein [Sessilibacter corallicola]|uniref:Uncharacterized protein n=1 Tax=Sessilibacter corallicola TaxID=2904075 RepID=A0ABQ0A9C2_9GAMM
MDKLTDSDIKEAVLSDKDSAMPTKDELKEFGEPKKGEIKPPVDPDASELNAKAQ